MSFLDSVKELITQKPPNLTGPFFYKADSDAKKQLEQLKKIYETSQVNIRSKIEQDIKMLTYGIIGEDKVAFELKNSYLPIIVLHDLRIEHEGLSSQIDYLVITQKFNLIIECKNLLGHIEVTSNGDFIRTNDYNGKSKKEGIYSPITQNQRHLALIKQVRLSRKNNFIIKTLVDKFFDQFHKSVVVLANPKTVIDMAGAKQEVTSQIIRCDQLIGYIKKLIKESKNEPSTEKEMYELADFYLSIHKPNTLDYTKKYIVAETEQKESQYKTNESELENTPLYKELKQYRYETSKVEGLKAYLIYNNKELAQIISAMPKTMVDLKRVPGFGDVKCNKYGNAILDIVRKYN